MSERGHAPTRKGSPAWKRWGLRLALVLAVLVALGLLIRGIILLRAGRAIRRELEAIGAANEPLNWKELLRTDTDGHVQPTGDFSRSEVSLLYARALAKTKGWSTTKGKEAYDKLREGNLSSDDLKVLGGELQKYQEALDLFRQAAQHQEIAILPGSTVEIGQAMPELALMREGARLLTAQAVYSAAQGKGDEAADWSEPGARVSGKALRTDRCGFRTPGRHAARSHLVRREIGRITHLPIWLSTIGHAETAR